MLFKNKAYTIGLVLFSWILLIFIVTSIIESVKMPLSMPYIVIFNLLFFGSWFYAARKAEGAGTAINITVFPILIICASLLIGNHFYDFSYDGQAYHGDGINGIRNGWNPFYNRIPESIFSAFVVNPYAKASWVVGGFIYKMTGHFQAAKAGNLILMIANLLIALPFLKQWVNNKLIAWVLALLLAFNPVSLNMYLSNMLDSQIANCIIILFILCVQYLTDQRNNLVLLLLCATVIYLINLKYTSGVYSYIFYAGLCVYLLVVKKLREHKKLLISLAVALFLGVVYWGYPTYVRNTIEYGHPFHPLAGPHPVAGIFAKDYMSGNQVVNFTKAIFAKTTYDKATKEHIQYKIPFTMSRYELERYGFSGVMIGGFGVWFSGIVLLTIALLCYTLYRYRNAISKESRINLAALSFTILLSVWINQHGYIARYVPQLWMLPVIVYLFYYYYSGKNNILARLLLIVMCINCLLVNGYTYLNFMVTNKRNEQLAAMHGKTYNVVLRQHTTATKMLEEHNIDFKVVDSLDESRRIDTFMQSNLIYQEKAVY